MVYFFKRITICARWVIGNIFPVVTIGMLIFVAKEIAIIKGDVELLLRADGFLF